MRWLKHCRFPLSIAAVLNQALPLAPSAVNSRTATTNSPRPRASWPKPSINTSWSIAAASSPTKRCSGWSSRLDTGRIERRSQNEERRSDAQADARPRLLRSSLFTLSHSLPAASCAPRGHVEFVNRRDQHGGRREAVGSRHHQKYPERLLLQEAGDRDEGEDGTGQRGPTDGRRRIPHAERDEHRDSAAD